MENQADGLFKKMVQILELMRQTAASEPSNSKIAIELQKYERELYLNLRDYGGLLRQALQIDRLAAEEGLVRDAEITRLRNQLIDDDDDLSWDAPVRQPTVEMPAPPPMRTASPTTEISARPLPPRSSEERPVARPRSASEILSQLHAHPPPSGES